MEDFFERKQFHSCDNRSYFAVIAYVMYLMGTFVFYKESENRVIYIPSHDETELLHGLSNMGLYRGKSHNKLKDVIS